MVLCGGIWERNETPTITLARRLAPVFLWTSGAPIVRFYVLTMPNMMYRLHVDVCGLVLRNEVAKNSYALLLTIFLIVWQKTNQSQTDWITPTAKKLTALEISAIVEKCISRKCIFFKNYLNWIFVISLCWQGGERGVRIFNIILHSDILNSWGELPLYV